MGDSADKIRQQMRDIRRGMGADVKDIVHSAQQLSDWRFYVRKFPWLSVGSAFALGVLLAPRKRTPGGVELEKLAAQARQSQSQLAEMLGARAVGGGMLSKLLAVAGPFVVRSATNYLTARIAAGRAADDATSGESFEPTGKPR